MLSHWAARPQASLETAHRVQHLSHSLALSARHCQRRPAAILLHRVRCRSATANLQAASCQGQQQVANRSSACHTGSSTAQHSISRRTVQRRCRGRQRHVTHAQKKGRRPTNLDDDFEADMDDSDLDISTSDEEDPDIGDLEDDDLPVPVVKTKRKSKAVDLLADDVDTDGESTDEEEPASDIEEDLVLEALEEEQEPDLDELLALENEEIDEDTGDFVGDEQEEQKEVVPEPTNREKLLAELAEKYPPLPERTHNLVELLEKAGYEEEAKAFAEEGWDEVDIIGIEHDSRKVKEGELFVCIKGGKHDGRLFAAQAAEAGAAILADTSRTAPDWASKLPKDLEVRLPDGTIISAERYAVDMMSLPSDSTLQEAEELGAPIVLVDDAREALHALATEFYDDPSTRMTVVGVTGTNGKTTTTWLIRGILEECDYTTGLIGTIEYALAEDRLTEDGELWVPEQDDPTELLDHTAPFELFPYVGKYSVPATTPDGLHVQRIMAGMADRGATHCVMEVSSHGLDQGRVDYVDFNVAVFTNISRDHMDYHGSMEAYLSAKASLFERLDDPDRHRAVINIDDPCADRFKSIVDAVGVPVWTYARYDREADVIAEKVTSNMWESEIVVSTPLGRLQIITPLLGEHNVMNVLAAVATGLAMQVPLKNIVAGIEATEIVPGRMEQIDEGQPFPVIVDYAHTPDALSRLLDTVRAIPELQRIILVFGCGGDRDRGKRALMGEIAHWKADIAIVTSDNPRTELPRNIIADVVAGFMADPDPDDIPIEEQLRIKEGAHIEVSSNLGYAPPGLMIDPLDRDMMEFNALKSAGVQSSQYEMCRRYVIEDRHLAIFAAIGTAGPKDVVLIAGKGHEDYQEVSDERGGTMRCWFDDRVEARAMIARLPLLNASKLKLNRKDLPWLPQDYIFERGDIPTV